MRCEHKNKHVCTEIREEYKTKRRMALRAGMDDAYAQCVIDLVSEEEKNMNNIIEKSLKYLQIPEATFGNTMQKYQQDQKKGQEIMEIHTRSVFDIPEEKLLDELTCL